MPAMHDIFAHELQHYQCGRPMYFPEPSEEGVIAQLGDVGYMQDGQFFRLFNATLPQDHPSNVTLGVPEDFTPLQITGTHNKPNHWRPGALTSTTIWQTDVNLSASGYVGFSFDFQIHDVQTIWAPQKRSSCKCIYILLELLDTGRHSSPTNEHGPGNNPELQSTERQEIRQDTRGIVV